MKIEVGDYVRTVDGVIAKVKTIRSYYKTKIYHFDNTLYQDWDDDIDYLKDNNLEKNIVKHSKNIIDLIEVGDYVNGALIVYIDKKEDEICTPEKIYKLSESKIERIVTKEQFESVEYKVGE